MKRWGIACLLGALLSWAICAPVWARMQRVDPGEIPKLSADEGLVLIAVDTDFELEQVALNKDGKVFGEGTMSQLKPGRTFRLYVAPVGDYTWKRITLLTDYYNKWSLPLKDSDEFRFHVESGRITYPGDLLVRSAGRMRSNVEIVNRSLAAIDWLQAQHAQLQTQVPMQYVGHYPDPFPAFYRQVQAERTVPASEPTLAPPPAAGELPAAADVMLRRGRLDTTRLNPRGDLLAVQLQEGKDKWRVELIDLTAQTRLLLASSVTQFDRVQWTSDESLLLQATRTNGDESIQVLRASRDAKGARQWTTIQLPSDGDVVSVLEDEPDVVLFMSYANDGRPMVYRLPIVSQRMVNDTRPRFADRLNFGLQDDIWWMADGKGRLRLATVRRDNERVMMYRGEDGEYREVKGFADLEEFQPVGLSYDASEIYALSDQGREQRDLVAYDVASQRITRTLFSRPGVDVERPIFGPHRSVIGVNYYRDGHLVSEYFGESDTRLAASLRAAMPGRNVLVVDRSRDGNQAVVWVDAADQPGQLYHLDVTRHAMSLVDEDRPWLEKQPLAPTQMVAFKGSDGMPLQAFLTLPPGKAKRPLVVFPHGGPIGVADALEFDDETQFLASLGYAVLRVNFRGSDGYGRAFRDAGRAGYGTLIEDDIDAAINTVLASQPLDEHRMCVVGASYGGYSALVMAMRWPERFRCVASIAGVADRILFYTASDTAARSKGRAYLERALGDPRTEAARMQDTSPLYHYDRIKVPVMLAHGLEDRRVDYEHMRRMQRMLVAAGNVPVGLTFKDDGHGFEQDSQVKLWNGVAGFLRAHLDDAPPATAQATTP